MSCAHLWTSIINWLRPDEHRVCIVCGARTKQGTNQWQEARQAD